MDAHRYARFTTHLVESARRHPDVIGLVALGSTADRSHAPDEWSDHDVWLITRDGAAAALRDDRTWLPDPSRIVAHFVETRHGRGVIYDDGHLIELAVFDDHELEIARANDHRVLYDAAGIADRLASIAVRTAAETDDSAIGTVEAGRFVTHLIIGLGRYGRGEFLSANQLIRELATANLLRLIAAYHPTSTSALDTLDPHRRFEQAYPEISERLDHALQRPAVDVAETLVDLAAELLGDRVPGLTPATLDAVRGTVDRARAARRFPLGTDDRPDA